MNTMLLSVAGVPVGYSEPRQHVKDEGHRLEWYGSPARLDALGDGPTDRLRGSERLVRPVLPPALAVLAPRHEVEVPEVDARPVEAGVVERHALRDIAHLLLPDEAVSLLGVRPP